MLSGFLTAIVTHVIALLLGAGGGWWMKGRYAAKAAAELQKVAGKL